MATATVSAAMLVAVVFATPARAATRHVDCGTTGLQSAIDAASQGDTLVVEDTCQGTFVVDKDLTLEGTATLDGMDAGTTLTVSLDATVAIRDITIANGRSDTETGGGIDNSGALILRGTSSVQNNAGPGITNWGILIMRGSATVDGNTGGGVHNRGMLTMNGVSSVVANTSSGFGGGIDTLDGTTVMNDWSSVRDNVGSFFGGGLSVFDSRLEMNDQASVVGNRITAGGGGIWIHKSVVTLSDSASVRGNTANGHGGGILVSDGLLTFAGWSSVSNNRAERGGGIWNEGAGDVHLGEHAAITGNRATRFGGGIWNGGCTDEIGPTVTMDDASVVRGNAAGTTTQPGDGGGIYSFIGGFPDEPDVCSGITNLLSGRIVRNHARGGGSGGGVFGPVAVLGPDMTIRRNTPNDCDPPC